MTAFLTTGLLVLLWLVIALPGVAAVSRPKAAIFAAPFYLALVLGLFLYHVGFSFGGADLAQAEARDGPSSLCDQAIEQSERGGLIVDRSNPARVSVRRGLWQQLPQQARDGIVMCLQAGHAPGSRGAQVEVVEVD